MSNNQLPPVQAMADIMFQQIITEPEAFEDGKLRVDLESQIRNLGFFSEIITNLSADPIAFQKLQKEIGETKVREWVANVCVNLKNSMINKGYMKPDEKKEV